MKSFDEFNREIESRSRYWTIDGSHFAKEMYEEGQQSKQAEVDELRKRIDEVLDHAVNHGGYDDLTHIINILKGDQP